MSLRSTRIASALSAIEGRAPGVPPSRLGAPEFTQFLFLAVHLPFGLIARTLPELVTPHAAVTLLYGLWRAAAARQPESAIYVAGYIVGAEVLWRMCRASVAWEFGKYSIVAIAIVASLRLHRRSRVTSSALTYLAFLLPGAVLTFTEHPLSIARQVVSFNMSGPLTFAVVVVYLSRGRSHAISFGRLLVVTLSPILSVAMITLLSTFSGSIVFTQRSNFDATGGFGPNQVSSVLGLGAFLAFLSLFVGYQSRFVRVMLLGLVALLAIPSAMTFSRGGIFSAIASALVAALFLGETRRTRWKVVLASTAIVGLANWVVVPRLDRFTEGAFTARFRSTDPTNRDRIALEELDIWRENPVLGVGAGGARFHRLAESIAPHTEFTRLLAEHGVLGLLALLLMLSMTWRNFRLGSSGSDRALVGSLAVWSLLFMSHSAMRLAAPAFFLALAAAFRGRLQRSAL